jgi:DNA-binding transcriptional regulator YhcF (GntR family)
MDVHPVDASSGTPPYEQLRTQIAARVASGELATGTRLPTVRALAAELQLAVNTVARVYRELEADGVVVTEGRRGTFVATSAAAGSGEARRAADQYAAALRRLGVSLPEAHKMLDQAWSGP